MSYLHFGLDPVGPFSATDDLCGICDDPSTLGRFGGPLLQFSGSTSAGTCDDVDVDAVAGFSCTVVGSTTGGAVDNGSEVLINRADDADAWSSPGCFSGKPSMKCFITPYTARYE